MQQEMIWHIPKIDSKVLVEIDVVSLLDNYKQNTNLKPESGGILLGYRRGKHLHIVQATTPQKDDVASRCSFTRKDPSHQSTALAKWRESGEILDYVGDWHTHPEYEPSPSRIDFEGWKQLITRVEKPFVFMITGITGQIWVGVAIENDIIKAKLSNEN